MKKKIFIDFEMFIKSESTEPQNIINFEPKEEAIELLKALNWYYDVFIFTTREREPVYKWFIKQHLDSFIKNVVSEKAPESLLIDDKTIKLNCI